MWIHIDSLNLGFSCFKLSGVPIKKTPCICVRICICIYISICICVFIIAFGIDGSIWETKEDPRTISLPSLPLFTPVSNSHLAGRPLDQNLNQQFYLSLTN